MAALHGRLIEFDEGIRSVEDGFYRLKRYLQGEQVELCSAKEFMQLYTVVYDMCTQKPPYDFSEALYDRFRQDLASYLKEAVLPALKQLSGEALLRELVARWDAHALMTRWLSRIYAYLDRYHVQRHNLDPLARVGLLQFYSGAYAPVSREAGAALRAMVAVDREGQMVDRQLLRRALAVLRDVGAGSDARYAADFESGMLSEAAARYATLSARWLALDDVPGYLRLAEAALATEDARAAAYMHAETRPKLLDALERELLAARGAQLLERPSSGAAALLRLGAKDDLARMHRLFSRVNGGLDPLTKAFRAHVEQRGLALVAVSAAAASAASPAAPPSAGAPPPPPSPALPAASDAFVRQLISLHDEYGLYVTDCFAGSGTFRRALKEAFEVVCNKQVGGAPVAELLAAFCDRLLRKGGGAAAGSGGAAGAQGASAELRAARAARLRAAARAAAGADDDEGGGDGGRAAAGEGPAGGDGGGDAGEAGPGPAAVAPSAVSTSTAAAAATPAPSRVTEEELESLLDRAVRLLAYVRDKDIFQRRYQTKLGRRLLDGTTASEETERGALAKLKAQCGAQFTSRMEGMVNDLSVARANEQRFSAWREARGSALPVDLSVNVLTSGFWPEYPRLELRVPEALAECQRQFAAFHEGLNNGRKLDWKLTLGTVHVRAAFDGRTYELVLAPIQAAVLLAVEEEADAAEADEADAGAETVPADADDGAEDPRWVSYAALQRRTELPAEDLDRALASLSLLRHKLLLKEPAAPRRVQKTDSFAINSRFSEKMRRIRVPLPQAEDRKKVQQDVQRDRRHAVEAAIVRVMKSRRQLSHASLVAEVVGQLSQSFTPDVPIVKRCVESLIEREYLERDETNPGIYKYIA